MSFATNANGSATSRQDFDAWGAVRSGGVSATSLNDTGQRLDSTGLLDYHARLYDPVLARFVSADSVVPSSASGGLDGVQLRPLTADFHEPGFVATLNGENTLGFWFQLSGDDRQQAGVPWGPHNPQALNRYSYVLNAPVRWTDPSGHWTISIGVSLRLGAIGGGSYSDGIIFDGHGTVKLYSTPSGGVTIGASASASLTFSYTSADTVDQTSGPGRNVGFSSPVVGADYVEGANKDYWGGVVGVGPDFGGDIHIENNTTSVAEPHPIQFLHDVYSEMVNRLNRLASPPLP